jgi:hypothetical protein
VFLTSTACRGADVTWPCCVALAQSRWCPRASARRSRRSRPSSPASRTSALIHSPFQCLMLTRLLLRQVPLLGHVSVDVG